MLETILSLDTKLFLYINNNFHNEFLDSFMLAISYSKFVMLAFILGLLSFGYLKIKKSIFLAFFFTIVAFGLSDSISTRVFKDNFERLRPCHEQALKDKVHLAAQKCGGGKFGFVSSHASNTFAIAMFFWLLLRKQSKYIGVLFIYAGLVSYSRIYLARHYPLDIFFGGILGIGCAYFAYRLYIKTKKKFPTLA